MEWMHIIISAVSGGALAQFFTLIVQRKKAVAEVKTNELENVGSAIGIWKNIAVDMEERLQQAEKRVTALIGRVGELEERERELKKELEKYKKHNE